MTAKQLDDWFVDEVLPLEPVLMRYLRRNWRVESEVADLRQDVYVRVYEAAAVQRPQFVKAFVLATARHLLIDRARRAKVVPIEAFADVEALELARDELTPERHVAARMELSVLQEAYDSLPPRCREVVQLRRIKGLSQREVAQAMGIAEDTVENQLAKGIRVMAAALLAGGMTMMTTTLSSKRRKQLKSA